MFHLELFGTVTSPYVRRVRMLCSELGVEYQLVNTADSEGQAALRRVSPAWKVPVVSLEGDIILDSQVITRVLMQRFGPGSLAPFDINDLELMKLITVTDAALDSLINVFYLGKEGVSRETPYVDKQYQRAQACLSWLESVVQGGFITPAKSFGIPEVALLTSLDWMRFRDAYPIANHPTLVAFLEAHAARPSVVETQPVG